ncbi:MAG: small conductance mechanosensitive channel [Phormidesmis priestleyi Ana]|uniref:Small conductance mechanosensitive channel n=1 Tax=Phormidesmis priestleyi Ana TaxID=1666911 RepID=A0A0N8KNT9_9CYAN|nr:MAG: small conductance mechanosensitive channel [Phormidesmis priestleyi Ana]
MRHLIRCWLIIGRARSRQYWLCWAISIAAILVISLPASAQLNNLPDAQAGSQVGAQAGSQGNGAAEAPSETAGETAPGETVPGETVADDAETSQPDSAARPAINRLLPEQLVEDSDAIDASPVYLDGRVIFRVTAPASAGQVAAEERAQTVQQRINSLIRDVEDTDESVNVSVSIDEESNLPVILVNGQLLTTVTSLDAERNGYVDPYNLALTLETKLEQAFVRYSIERSPEFLLRSARFSAGILIGAVLLQILSRRWLRRIKNRQSRLLKMQAQLRTGEVTPKSGPVGPPATPGFSSVLDPIKARLDIRQKRKINETAGGLLLILQPVLWIGSMLGILSLFPYSRWLATLLLYWLEIPAKMLLLCGLAYMAVRLSSLAIDKVSLTLQEGTQWAPDQSQRRSLRFSTLSQVAKGIAGAIVLAITLLLILSIAGVQVAPLLAGAGIVGIGISLAAQSLIKDLINGCLILLEDQFGIGDVVSIDGFAGMVEYLNLRITQLRDTEGKLITIPNSQITVVQNLSMDWSQVDLFITVAPHNDLNQVFTLLKSVAAELADDDEWRSLILEPPDLLGVESLDYTGIQLRLQLKTQPLKQWLVARELRKRIKERFDKENIDMGLSQEQVAVRWDEQEENKEEKA